MFKSLLTKLFLLIYFFVLNTYSLAENHNTYETLEQIKKDIKTLEKAVYSTSSEFSAGTSNVSNLDSVNSEDVLTRHLLKLSEIESQFQMLTNRFEK